MSITAEEMGRRGGKATAAKLSPEQRSKMARKAALARWRNKRASRGRKKEDD